MAANAGKIKLELTVTDKGSSVVAKATGRMMTPLKKLGSRVAGIVKSFFSWRKVIGLLAGAAGIGLLIKKVVALSAAQEMAETKLEQAMRSTKMWNANLMESYKRYAAELQDLTGIGESIIMQMLSEPAGTGLAVACRANGLDKSIFSSIYALCHKSSAAAEKKLGRDLRMVEHRFDHMTEKAARDVVTQWRRKKSYSAAISELEVV